MNCCIDCFSDVQIRAMIDSLDQNGDCDFCGQKNTKCYHISKNGNVERLIEGVIDIYNASGSSTEGKMLNIALSEDWTIFAVSVNIILKILEAFFTECYDKEPLLLTSLVIIPESMDNDFLSVFSITRDKSWHDFSESLKYQNRFYNSAFNPDVLASFISYSVNTYPVGTIMYRARINSGRNGFLPDAMYAPPREKRSAGRVNPEGVGVLYLSSKSITALYEVRSNLYDYVTIGEFILLQDIKVVNLEGISSVSPFIYSPGNDLQQYAVNQKCLKEIAEDIGKPMRRNDSPLEYLPTQIISEYIKSQGYDGVEYASTMTKDGYNLAMFSETLFKCVSTKVYEVAGLSYLPEEVVL